MRSGAATACEGIFHETAIYASDTELRDTAFPFLREGLDAHEPTYVILGAHGERRVRQEFGEHQGLRYVPAADAYVKPAMTVRNYLEASESEVAAGAEQVRFITEVPHPGNGSAWDWWGRYESAVNEIFADLPVWAVCTYDERTTPASVLDEVRRSHPYIAGPDGRPAANGAYEPPTAFLGRRSCAYSDPLESADPLVELTDPGLAEARRAAFAAARERLGADAADNLALAVSEVVANGQRHGRAPLVLRVWADPQRVVATVKDGGAGPSDATVGLAPVDLGRSSGRGLWIANQLCDHLSLTRSDDGFEVKLVVGTPIIAH